jgi:hypothetical protein
MALNGIAGWLGNSVDLKREMEADFRYEY